MCGAITCAAEMVVGGVYA